MFLSVNNHLRLQLIEKQHGDALFKLVDKNRAYLSEHMGFAERMKDARIAHSFVENTLNKHAQGLEYAFVILLQDVMIGRIGVYKIDQQNKIGEIGYWIDEDFQGQGIITQSCKTLIHFCFYQLQINRIEIKCGTSNTKSMAIPLKLGFKKEGQLKQAELLRGEFIDLNLYALCKSDAGHLQTD